MFVRAPFLTRYEVRDGISAWFPDGITRLAWCTYSCTANLKDKKEKSEVLLVADRAECCVPHHKAFGTSFWCCGCDRFKSKLHYSLEAAKLKLNTRNTNASQLAFSLFPKAGEYLLNKRFFYKKMPLWSRDIQSSVTIPTCPSRAGVRLHRSLSDRQGDPWVALQSFQRYSYRK